MQDTNFTLVALFHIPTYKQHFLSPSVVGELKASQRQATEGAHRGQARSRVCALSAGDHGHKGELFCNFPNLQ